MTDYKLIADRVIEATSHFKDGLVNELGLAGPIVEQPERQTRNSLVEYFAKEVIDAEFADTNVAIVTSITKLVKELQALVETEEPPGG